MALAFDTLGYAQRLRERAVHKIKPKRTLKPRETSS